MRAGRVFAWWSACVLWAVCGIAGCRQGGEAALEVYAAASLRDAMVEVVALWKADGGGPVALNIGPSGGLARQILAARRADVFVSAGELELDRVEQEGLVVAGTRRDLLSNRLVVIEPAGMESLFAGEFAPELLLDEGLSFLSLGNPEYVPAGRYAKQWLERVGLWEALEGRVAPAVDVRAALAAVESGVARAGIVYATDAAISERVRVRWVVDGEGAPDVVLPVACVGGEERAERAVRFVDFLAGEAASGVFEEWGFGVSGRR